MARRWATKWCTADFKPDDDAPNVGWNALKLGQQGPGESQLNDSADGQPLFSKGPEIGDCRMMVEKATFHDLQFRRMAGRAGRSSVSEHTAKGLHAGSVDTESVPNLGLDGLEPAYTSRLCRAPMHITEEDCSGVRLRSVSLCIHS